MIKALWFAVRLALVVGLVVVLAEQTGSVQVVWRTYKIDVDLGFFLLVLSGLILLAIFLYNVFKTFIDFPKSLSRYNEIRRREKGYEALTLGLTAVAAGDKKSATAQAKKARKFLPEDTGLPVLLAAQAARLEGREAEAIDHFTILLEDKNASFLGVRGLLQRALDNNDPVKALQLAQKARDLHPKQPWILKIVYDLHIRLHQWSAALEMLDQVQKCKALSAEAAASERVALYMILADQDYKGGFENDARDKWSKALKLDAGFAPAAQKLARSYYASGYQRKARQVVEAAWKQRPHPDLAKLWLSFQKKDERADALAQLRWLEKLGPGRGGMAEGWLALAQQAHQAQLWGEAKAFLSKIDDAEKDRRYYLLMAQIERDSDGPDAAVQSFLEQAEQASPAPQWQCVRTGQKFSEWLPLTPVYGDFNTIKWVALSHDKGVLILSDKPEMGEVLLEAPE